MKRMIAILAAVAAFTLVADEAQDKADADAVVDVMTAVVREMEKVAADEKFEAQENAGIVKTVFGEDEKSSFIVKQELTATQKRFIALGRRLMQTAIYAQVLERRVNALEARLDEIDKDRNERAIKIQAMREKRERNANEKVRRAVEKANSINKKGAK